MQMDTWTDRWIDRYADGQMDEQTNKWVDGRTDGQIRSPVFDRFCPFQSRCHRRHEFCSFLDWERWRRISFRTIQKKKLCEVATYRSNESLSACAFVPIIPPVGFAVSLMHVQRNWGRIRLMPSGPGFTIWPSNSQPQRRKVTSSLIITMVNRPM